jgi:predicted alpha-1,2-mannosidase
MKRLGLIVFAFISLQASAQLNEIKGASDAAQKKMNPESRKGNVLDFDKLPFVNPFVGTGGHGHTYPGASAPFGMMQLSPDTRHDGWDGCSGYHYSDSLIYGFSHTHLSGTGVSDYGDLLIVPQIGNPRIDPGYISKKGYQATFSHEDEVATPGYYSVKLNDGDMNVRLTVSERAGYHQYFFNKESGKKFILIDLDHRDKLLSSAINLIDKKTISGNRVSHAWAEEQYFHFYLKMDTPYQKARIFKKNGRNKLLLIFPKTTKQISIKVGMSHVSEDGAKLNLEKELPDWNFETAKARVQKKWRTELDKISFYSKEPEVMNNFYTALYHSYLNPNVSSDVDGKYRYGDTIHQLEKGDYENYTVFSLWDTYRATHPLFTLTQVKRTNAFINTFLRFYDFKKDLPVWELAGNETECMIGYHSVSVISDAYSKRIYDYDARKAIEAMIATSNLDEFGKREYVREGFLSTGSEPESVSKTLEYAYDDYCIHEMINRYTVESKDFFFADKLDTYLERSKNFVNLYDPNTKFMRGRRSGQWHSPFDPTEVNFNYTEANSWQYSLYAPHAVGILRDLIGGKDSLETWLDRLFSTEMDLSGRHQVDITGLIGQYAHGNEPSHHMAYLYNYTNAPEKTQHYIDRIQREMYSNTPDGLSGNEDCGQMSAWYVLSALGIYQIAPGSTLYEFGRPLMSKAKIQFEDGKELSFNVKNNSPENKYIQKIVLNGVELKSSFISHSQLIKGGTIVITMQGKPNSVRKKYPHAETISDMGTFVPVPFFNQEERIFESKMKISLDVINNKKHTILYTLDGSDPFESESTKSYTGPFEISESTTIKAVANANSLLSSGSDRYSSIIENRFIKKNTNVSISVKSEYSNQYAAAGDFTLIDGIKGGDEFRTGDWQGYWDQDFEATVTFAKPTNYSDVSVNFLSDMKSWVFFPETITFEVTFEDGTKAVNTQTFDPEVKKDQYAHNREFNSGVVYTQKIKQITVKATPVKECPEWHLGVGNPTWLFIDEISFK